MRWTWNGWEQDNTSLTYPLNPRVYDERVGDGANVRRVVTTFASSGGSGAYHLPQTIEEYNPNNTVLRKKVIAYNPASAYTSRRLIALPTQVETWGWNSVNQSLDYASKETYAYDEGDFSDSTLSQTIYPTQHDATNYGSSFIAGRANLTSTTRHDVLSQSSPITSSIKYNTAGAPVSQTDPLARVVKIEYADLFNSSGNPTTYAYPTKLYDPAGSYSTIKYRYDFGANVEATSPAPAGQSYGKTTKRLFDSVGRLERDSVYISTAEKYYTRYAFPTNGIQSQSYSTLVDINANDYPDSSDEVYAESWSDGAGRTRQSRTEHPGSTGGWTGTLTDYDILGRVTRTSVPTEINSSYQASGDDAARGFIYNYQYYDWKNRPIRTVPSDSTGSDGKDTLITYEGCGCAGGQITTVKGPVTTAVDVGGTTQTTKRRTQKSYEDILGRTYKTEVWDLDGGGSVPYSTTKQWFNGRDQPTLVRHYSGSEYDSVYQDTTTTFDGHGRLKTSHKPEQDAGVSTGYTYNPDDSISGVTDGRGAVTGYTYNNRRLVTNIAWTVPGSSGITDPADVTLSYDNLGNRTAMSDELGSVAYAYDQLSRMTGETRTFSDTLADKPTGNFNLTYEYALAGQLKSYTDAYGDKIGYVHDKAGRLGTVTGTSYAGFSTYASNAGYRAWGGLKHLEYANGVQMDTAFNNKLQPAEYDLVKNTTSIMRKNYEYLNDGKLKFVDDEMNGIFDRLITYDHVGRMKEGKSSTEASGTTVTSNLNTQLPYRQSYTYNTFNNLTQRNNLHWGVENWYYQANNLSYTYSNNRVTNTGWVHDADGRVTQSALPDDSTTSEYDARGLLSFQHTTQPDGSSQTKIRRYNTGDGREGKRTKEVFTVNETPPNYGTWNNEPTIYYIRSSVLGGEVVSETTATGGKKKTNVIAAGTKIATQSEYTYNSATTKSVSFDHYDAAAMSNRTTTSGGDAYNYDSGYDGAPGEFDPMGGNMGVATPYVTQDPPPDPNPIFPFFPIDGGSPSYVNGQQVSCSLDGLSVSCASAFRSLDNGSAIPAGLAPYQSLPGFQFNSHGLGIYTANIPGHYFSTPNGSDSGNTIRVGSYGYAPPSTQSFNFNYQNISWAPQQQTQQQPERLDPSTVNILKTNLEKLMADKNCGDFINSVLAALKDKTVNGATAKRFAGSIGDLFERINGGGGFWKEGINALGLYYSGKITFGSSNFNPTGSGTLRYGIDGKNLVTLGPRVAGTGYQVYEVSEGLVTTFTLVHELVHSSYEKGHAASHFEMGRSAEKALKQVGLQDKLTLTDTNASAYFNAALIQACAKVKL
ncbi:MAG: hypothetical protein WKF34_07355 [Pyrinomonadaceae bacterium]